MSVHNLSRFVAHLALNYDKLRRYLDEEAGGSATFLPVGDDQKTLKDIERLCGLNEDEVALIREGIWEDIFNYIAEAGPRPMGEDQGNYP
ncbi:MAG: hypothetical protein GY719_35925 [bacterium]|nr:hypothetical protein [bacterium]